MIFLSENDLVQSVTYSDVVAAVEESFLLYEKKEFQMPDRMHIEHEENTLLLMPCFSGEYFATKLVSVFPHNAGTPVPVVNGVVVLNSASTGQPLALINGKTLTALRTGAVGAVGVKHLANTNASRLGIVGAGVQAFYQAMSVAEVRKLTDITVCARSTATGAAFAGKLRESLPEVNIHVASSVKNLLENSEIVIAATTATEPVLPDQEELLTGRHFVGIGSFQPHVREFPESLYRIITKVYVDTEYAAKESGDVAYPLAQGWITTGQVQTLGSFIVENKNNEAAKEDTTFFKSVGMALFDLVVARLIYEKALEKGLGKQLKL